MFLLEQSTSRIAIILLLSFLSFCIAMFLTPFYTAIAYKYELWKRPRSHTTTGEELEIITKFRIKRKVPLAAGIVALIAVTVTTLLYNLDRQQTWLPLAALLGGGIVGLVDDVINIRGTGGNVAGIRPQIKLLLMVGVGLIGAWFFYYKLGFTRVQIPFAGTWDMGWLIIPLFTLVVVSTSNAVNISDGMDGLAGGLLLSSFGAFAVIAGLQGNLGIAGFCMSVVGAILAYLWFNIPPARFIMGDVGSFSLGTALGVVAMLTNTLFLLPFICLVFVAEAGSSLLQILSKKFLHRKIFISAPVHHHLEAKGWPKSKVTMRFWVIGQVVGALGIILALIGGFVK